MSEPPEPSRAAVSCFAGLELNSCFKVSEPHYCLTPQATSDHCSLTLAEEEEATVVFY